MDICVCVQADACTSTTATMQCTDEGERDSALAVLLMNDLTFVLVTGKNLEGRATAQNNAALVNLSATQALVSPYWETVTLDTEHSEKTVNWLIPTELLLFFRHLTETKAMSLHINILSNQT